jgi:hypothetical protein
MSFALGLLALMMGLGATAGGVYLGMATSTRLVALPGGLAEAPSETVAIIMASCGAITMLLGVIGLHRAHDV